MFSDPQTGRYGWPDLGLARLDTLAWRHSTSHQRCRECCRHLHVCNEGRGYHVVRLCRRERLSLVCDGCTAARDATREFPKIISSWKGSIAGGASGAEAEGYAATLDALRGGPPLAHWRLNDAPDPEPGTPRTKQRAKNRTRQSQMVMRLRLYSQPASAKSAPRPQIRFSNDRRRCPT